MATKVFVTAAIV